MNYEINNKINDLFDYANRYQAQIYQENCKKEFNEVIDLLINLKNILSINISDTFPEAAKIYEANRTVRFLQSLELPKTATTANRIFKSVVMKEIQQTFGVNTSNVEIQIFQNQDLKIQAKNYEKLASLSTTSKDIIENLFCSLHCLKQLQDTNYSDDIKRIENLLSLLKTPIELGYALRYLFTGLNNHNIPFSIDHSRFTEVVKDFIDQINKTPTEETMVEEIEKWVSILKIN